MKDTELRLPEAGDLVAGRYRIVRELGRGGYGIVYQASQEAIDREVAIKFLLPEVANDPNEVERFRREIFHASSLEHHHTVTLYDYGQSPNGLFYVVMEYLEGITLGDLLATQGKLTPYQAQVLLEQVLGSLDEAHQRQLVHRDLKPENIFIQQTGDGTMDCRVLDFGLSKFIGDPNSTLYRGPSLTAEGEVCGTPQYMSPEHAYGEAVGPPADIYALGLMLYEMLVGEPAFNGKAALDILLKQVKEPTPDLPEDLADSHLAAFVIRATKKPADQRFADAAEALQWLYLQPPPPPDEHPTAPPSPALVAPSSSHAAPTPPSMESLPFVTTELDAPPADPASPGSDDDTPSGFEPTIKQSALHRPDEPPQDDVNGFAHLSRTQATVLAEETLHDTPSVDRAAALERFELRAAQMPLIGRRESLSRLDTWLDENLHRGGFFALTADAGTGKTALLDTWSARLINRRRLHLLRGTQPRNAAPLAGVRRMLNALLDGDPAASADDLTTQKLRQLAQLVNTTDEVDPTSDGSVSSVVHSLTQLLTSLCRNQPILLIFDDLHHADPVTRRFFNHLLDVLSEQALPLGVLLTARHPNTIRDWKRIANAPFVHMELPDLGKKSLGDMLQRLFPTAEGLAKGILSLASGNPALLLHISRYLLESDLIVYHEGRDCWDLRDPSIPIEELVPLDLQQLIIQRANRYLQESHDEADLRSILHRAVLLGDEFDAQLLEDCLHDEGRDELASKCRSLLAQLTASGLMEELPARGRGHYGFARPLHRASLVRMVESIDDWRDFHQLVAHRLIDDGDDARPLESARIAHHLEAAGRPDKALPWWVRAARRAEAEYRYQDALQMLHRALRLHSNRDADPSVLASMRLRQGRLSRHVGELGPAEDALRVAVDHARRCEDTALRARATELLAEVILLQGRIDEALALLDIIDDLYNVLDDAAGKQRTSLTRADVDVFRGDYASARKRFEKTRLSSSAKSSTQAAITEVRSLIGLARCHYAGGRLARAAELADEAQRRAHRHDLRRLESAALVENAHIALLTDGVEASESLAHQALTLARRCHDALGQANAHLALGIALRRSTNVDRALFHSLRARELHESLGHLYGILKDILLSAELAWVQGEYERALILSEDACNLHRELGDQHGWALSTTFQALFLIELDQPARARSMIHQVLEIEGRDQLGLYEGTSLFYLGLAEEAEFAVDEALQYFAEAQRIATQQGHRELVSLTSAHLAMLRLVQGELDLARAELDLARREAEHLSNAYANIFVLLTCALIARLDGHPQALRSAMTQLRTYLSIPHAPTVRLTRRLELITTLLSRYSVTPHRRNLVQAIDDLLRDLDDLPH